MLNNRLILAGVIAAAAFGIVDGGNAEARHCRCHGGRVWRQSGSIYGNGYQNTGYYGNSTGNISTSIPASNTISPPMNQPPATNAPAPRDVAPTPAPAPVGAPAPAPSADANAANLDGTNPQAVKPDRAP